MNPVHTNFKILLNIKEFINKNVVYISDLTPDRSKWYKWLPMRSMKQVCYQIFTTLDMSRVLIKSQKVEAIFIFEHKPQYSLLLYIICIIKNVPVFFIVHGIQQTQNKSVLHFFGVEILRWLVFRFKFWPIHLEITDRGVPEIRHFFKSIVIPHPLAEESTISSAKKKDSIVTVIGIAGMLRDDKPIMPIIRIILDYIKNHDNVEFYVGTPFWQTIPLELKKCDIKLVDTTSRAQFFTFLKSLDIIITDFDRESFYFRPSGIINDSISCGCFVIAPDYPVFKAQLNNPIKVGETYQRHEELEATITKSINFIKLHNIDFHKWIEVRSNNNIVDLLGKKILEIIEYDNK